MLDKLSYNILDLFISSISFYNHNDTIDVNEFIDIYFRNCLYKNQPSLYLKILNNLRTSNYKFSNESMKSLLEYIKESKIEYLNESLSKSKTSEYLFNLIAKKYANNIIDTKVSNNCEYLNGIYRLKIEVNKNITKDEYFRSLCNFCNYKWKFENNIIYCEPQIPESADELVYNKNNVCYKVTSLEKANVYKKEGIFGSSNKDQWEYRNYMFAGNIKTDKHLIINILNFINERNKRVPNDWKKFNCIITIDLSKIKSNNPNIYHKDIPKFYHDPAYMIPAVFTDDYIPKECIVNITKI